MVPQHPNKMENILQTQFPIYFNLQIKQKIPFKIEKKNPQTAPKLELNRNEDIVYWIKYESSLRRMSMKKGERRRRRRNIDIISHQT